MEFNQIIVTLYEGHYHFGVAALINSLVKSNFEGLFIIGYRGHLPTWHQQMHRLDENHYLLSENKKIVINFSPVNPDMHFGYYKPFFLQDTLVKYREAARIYYFDPDIVVNTEWSFYISWVQSGIALCLDNCFPFVHRSHPWRKEWAELADSNSKCQTDFYFNSGFIGLERKDASILKIWIELTKKYEARGGNIANFEKAGHRAFKTDQDLLNAAISINPELNISIIGTEGMGFSLPAYLMSHAVDSIKPWKKNYIIHLIKTGRKPYITENHYIKYANHPISPYSNFNFLLKKLNLKFASILGRLIG